MIANDRYRLLRSLFAMLVTTCILMVADVARADDPADTLFREGVTAINENNPPLAYEKFKAAWNLKQTFDIAANLGVVEKAMGKKRDAAEHLDYALRHFPLINSADQRSRIEKELAELKKELGELRVQSATGATIEINGVVVGTAPLNAPVFVEPGQQIIVAKKSNIGEGKITVVVAVGEGKDIRVELALSGGPTTSQGSSLPLWPGFVIGGAGLAAAAAGVALIVVGQGSLSDAEESGASIASQGGRCEPPSGPGSEACADVQNSLDSAGLMTGVGIGLAAGGGALLIGGIIWLVVPRADSAPKAGAQMGFLPIVTPDTAGMVFSGTF